MVFVFQLLKKNLLQAQFLNLKLAKLLRELTFVALMNHLMFLCQNVS